MTHACVKATIGAVGSSALLGPHAPGTSADGSPAANPHAGHPDHGAASRWGADVTDRTSWRVGTNAAPEEATAHGPGTLVHFHRSICAIGPPMVRLDYETTSLCSSFDRG